MRAAVEHYPSLSQTGRPIMRDYNIIMNEAEFDERDVIAALSEDSFNRRSEILEQLRNSVRINQTLPFKNTISLFRALNLTLSDTNWDVRRQCLLLVSEYIPLLRVDVDACMGIILPRIIQNIGDTKVVIRKDAIQTLHVYMKHTCDMPAVMHCYVASGLESEDSRVRKESIVSLPVLITSDFTSEDFMEVIVSLCKKLVDRDEDEGLQNHSKVTLNKLRASVGDSKFRAYLMRLTKPLRDYYCRLVGFELSEANDDSLKQLRNNNNNNTVSNAEASTTHDLIYGVIPHLVMSQLSDQENLRSRCQAVEELKQIMENLTGPGPLIPHLENFIRLLNDLLDDTNFKIITVTLDVLGILVEKLAQNIRPHLKIIINTLTKRMHDNKNVIRQAITKVILQLMQSLGPKLVLMLLNDNLTHRSPRVRTETINCIIIALLKFPRYQFDLDSLCSNVAYCLLDQRRTVRHACLECLAVIAQCLGAGKLQPLLTAVDAIDNKFGSEGTGVKQAVQARLTRRALPKVNEDNLVEYAVQLTSLNSSRNGTLGHHGEDVDWIGRGSGGGGGSSARSMKLEDLESTSRQSSASLEGQRRQLSSGKRGKLPWDERGQSSPKSAEVQSPSKAKVPQSWADDTGSLTARKSKPSDDLLLASINFNGSTEHLSVQVGNDQEPKPAAAKSPFSKSTGKSINKGDSSNSWSVSSPTTNRSIGSKPVLNPLPAEGAAPPSFSYTANTWGYDPNAPFYNSAGDTVISSRDNSQSSFPVKPSPVTRRSGAKKAKVPPIPKSDSPVTSPYDETPSPLVEDNNNELPQLPESSPTTSLKAVDLNASLNKIRNSANKKKAEKLFEKIEKRESEAEVQLPPKIPGVRNANPFEAKPKLARHTHSQSQSKTYTELHNQSSSGQDGKPPNTSKSQPTTNQTANNRKPADKSRREVNGPSNVDEKSLPSAQGNVVVVGKGYGDEPVETPPKNSLANLKGSRERRRNSKAVSSSMSTASFSPLGMAAASSPGMIPISSEDFVEGKGVFEGDIKTRGERSNSISLRSDRSNSISKATPTQESDEELNTLQMSRALRENAAKKKKERQEESAAKRRAQQEREEAQRRVEEEQRKHEQELAAERRRKQQEASEKRRRELEQRKREQSTADDVSASQADSALRIAGSSTLKSNPTPPLSASSSVTPNEALEPFNKPEAALRGAIDQLSNEDWSIKNQAINSIRRLTSFHPEVISPQLHQITLSILAEVKNLRTQVARLAIIALGDLFSSLRKAMDPELEACSKVLLHKNGEANEFIRTELDRTLGVMVAETTPQRCLTAFIAGGASHKNTTVRRATTQHMVVLCEKLGPGRLLSGVKDLTDRILPTVATLCVDQSPEPRWYGRRMLQILLMHSDFEAVANKHLSPKDMRTIKEVADIIKQRGLGDIPSDSLSAKGARRSGTFNRGSRTNSAESSDSVAQSVKRRSLPPSAMEETNPLLTNMSSTNWNERYSSIDEMTEFLQNKPRIFSAQSMKILDKYCLLIKDSNSKVAIHALEVLLRILPELRPHIPNPSINILIQNTAAGLACKNADINELCSRLLDEYINKLEHIITYQPFIQVAKNCTAKVKPDIIDRLAYLSKKVYKTKPKAVTLHALPLAFDLVRSSMTTSASGPLRSATQDFLAMLYELMGPTLFDHAASTPNSNPQLVEQVKLMAEGRNS